MLLQSMFPAIGAQGNNGLLMAELGESTSGMIEVMPGREEEG